MEQELFAACTLGADARTARRTEWQALREAALLDEREEDGVRVSRFRVSAERDLAALVEAERDCCGFLGWEIERERDALVLRVRPL